ncbi:DGQHR domain-containing protein [Candidatus Marinimicrobia bacterium]|nr:DGQHR domain-containing protein [Candidatus Neomarinimicrobiota bacterium]
MPVTIDHLVSRNSGIPSEKRRRINENKTNIRSFINANNDREERPLTNAEFFENRVWLLFEQFIGPDEDNPIINFLSTTSLGTKITWGSGGSGETQQIDGFFVSKSISFITESTTCDTASLDEKINDFSQWKSSLEQDANINTLNSENPTINFREKKFVWLLCSENSPNDDQITHALNENINIISLREIEYMENLISVYGKKYSNLAFINFIKDIIKKPIPTGEQITVPAIRYKYGTGTGRNAKYCYSAVVKPDDILNLCSVIHRKAGLNFDKSYQRFVTQSRLKNIQEFVDDDTQDKISQFSNNLILCSETLDKSRNNFRLSPPEHQPDNSRDSGKIGTLKLPAIYGDLHIIDGQHRLFGYNNAENKDKHFVNVLIFNYHLTLREQMNVFKDINENQKNISPNLRWELYEHTLSTDDIKQQISQFFNKNLIDENFNLFKRVQVGTKIQKEGKGSLKLSLLNICQEMTKYKRSRTDSILFKKLYDFFPTHKEKNTTKLFNGFLKSLKDGCPEDWDMNGDGLILSGGYFRALLRVFREIIWTWESDQTLDNKLDDLDNINEHFSDILSPFFDFVNEIDSTGSYEKRKDKKTLLKKETLGAAGPTYFANKIAKLIRESSSEHENFGDNSIYKPDSNFKIWYRYTSQILKAEGEKIDIEAKDGIFPTKVRSQSGKLVDVDLSKARHKSQINKEAKEKLRTLAAFYHTVGGVMIFGIENNSWNVIGCDNEIEVYGGFDAWQSRLENLIESATIDFPRLFYQRCKLLNETVDDKRVIGIVVKKKTQRAPFCLWKIKNDEPYDHYYYRNHASTVHIQQNPTPEDYEFLKEQSEELSENLMYKSEGALRTLHIEESADFDILYSDNYRLS